MRPGRVEVYRSTRLRPIWADCTDRDSCGDLTHAPNGEHLVSLVARGWRWRFRAPNGAIISAGSEGYDRLRDIARSLELAFPGYRLLDQNGALLGPHWFLCGLEVSRPEAYPQTVNLSAWPPAAVLGVGMRIHRIPVTSPVNLGSRR